MSAEEARGLLEAYSEPAAGRPLTLNCAGDTAMFRAAPALARTVVALSEDFDRQADEIMAAYAAIGATPGQTVARKLSALCGDVVAERDRALSERDGVARENAERRHEINAWMAAVQRLTEERDEARRERDRLRLILACERGEWAPEGWERNDFDPECIGLAWYRSTGTGDSETPDHGDTVLWVYREPPSSLWTWEVERYDADGDNYDHVNRGEAPTALEAIEQADLAAKEPK